MKNIIIDTSCILAVVLEESSRAELIAATEGATLLAPDSLSWELGNAFSALFKKGTLSLKEAKTALHAVRQIPIRFIYPDMERAIEIAHEQRIYAYEAYMLAVCEECRAPLLTLDTHLRRSATALKLKTIEV